jgi:hypothetical protein
MFLLSAHGFWMGSAWISKLSTGDRRSDIGISPTVRNDSESMRMHKNFGLLKSPNGLGRNTLGC